MSEKERKEKSKTYTTEMRWKRVERLEKEEDRKGLILELVSLIKESRSNEDKIKGLEKLKEVYLDEGFAEKALNCLNALIKINPANGQYFRQKGLILEEIEDFNKAREVYIQGYEATGDKRFLPYIKDVETSCDGEEKEILNEEREFFPYTNGDAFKILNLFEGREGVYARQWTSQTGDTGYSPINEALTPNVVLQHLNGSITIGVYQIRLDNTVSFIAFDIDIKKNIYSEIISNEKEFLSVLKRCERTAKEIVNILASKGIESYVEFSGNKGYHVWIFLSSPVSAKIGKDFCDEVLKRVEGDEKISIEGFPKQSYVREGRLGNLIKLPYGYHLKTGKRSFFVDGEFKEIVDQRGFLHSIKKVSKSLLIQAMTEFESENLWIETKNSVIKPPKDDFEVFDEGEFIPEHDEELQKVLEGCPVLKTIYTKALNSERLNAKEVGVLKYTLGCLKNGVEIVNYAFKKAGVEEEHFLKSKLNGNPTSCEKIRSKVPEISNSVDCACVFDKEQFAYSTPNIYAKEKSFTNGSLLNLYSLEKIFEKYLSLKKEKRRVEKSIKEIEKKLNSLFDETGIEEVKLPNGVLKRKKEGDGRIKFVYEIE